MKTWQAVLASASLLACGYMLNAHAAKPADGGKWHMVTSAAGVGGAWLYNDQDEKAVYWCSPSDATCIKGGPKN